MASWDSYTQKATPEDNDTLMIKDTAGAANKRTPFSGVWNWIVSKLTSAVISNLQTNSKSIIPAINELNSKFSMRENLTVDCNTVTDFLAFCNSNSLNLPIQTYGILMTLVRDTNIRVQVFWTTAGLLNTYTRTSVDAVWDSWHRIQFET